MTEAGLQMLRLPLPTLPHDSSMMGVLFREASGPTVSADDGNVVNARAELNKARDEIDSVDIAEWRSFSKKLNALDGLTKDIRARVGFDLPLVNNAWAKFYEVLVAYGPRMFENVGVDKSLRTMHLCECPGGFVAALNVYLAITHPDWVKKWQWLGASLNPYYEANDLNQMVDDDALYRRTQDRWWTGPDGSGNILQSGAAQDMWRWFGSRAAGEKCHVVTADGSMDVQYDPNKQESLCLPIIFRELLLAVGLLHPGGTFVMKAYSLLDDATVAALSLAAFMFDTVEVVKPVASKEANSETYWVCLGFRGLAKADGAWLREALAVRDPRVELGIPTNASQSLREFVRAARQVAVTLAEKQTEAIKGKLTRWREMGDSDPQPYPKKQRTINSLSGDYVRMLIPPELDLALVKPLLPADTAGRLGGVDSRRASRGTVEDRRHDHEDDAALGGLRENLAEGASFSMQAVTNPTSRIPRIPPLTAWLTFTLTTQQLSECPGAYRRITSFTQVNNVKIPNSWSVVYSPLVRNATELKALVRKRLLRFEKCPTVQPRSPGDAVTCSLTGDERNRAVIAELLKEHASVDPDHVSTWDSLLHKAAAIKGKADVSVKMLADHSLLVDPFSRQFDPATREELIKSTIDGVEALTIAGSSVLLLELGAAPVVAIWLGSLLFRLAQLFNKIKLVQPCSDDSVLRCSSWVVCMGRLSGGRAKSSLRAIRDAIASRDVSTPMAPMTCTLFSPFHQWLGDVNETLIRGQVRYWLASPIEADSRMVALKYLADEGIKHYTFEGNITKSVGVFFGTFDPIHENHWAIVEYALSNNLVTSVLLVANTENNPSKPKATDLETRQCLLRERVRASGMEGRVEVATGYSGNSQRWADREALAHALVGDLAASTTDVLVPVIMCGEDSFMKALRGSTRDKTTRHFIGLAELDTNIIVFPRSPRADALNDAVKEVPPRIRRRVSVAEGYSDPHPRLSSSQIRAALAVSSGSQVSGVEKSILSSIRERKLYQ